jgi:signal transduction histidine kinase
MLGADERTRSGIPAPTSYVNCPKSTVAHLLKSRMRRCRMSYSTSTNSAALSIAAPLSAGSQGGTVRTHLRKPKISDRGNILIFDKGVGLDLRNEPQRPARRQRIEAERMSAIGRMACSISHDMRHSLTAIYANAEFLERHDICASVRADLLLEIQEAVLAMTERIESLLQFGSSGRKSPLVHARVSLIVEKAVGAVKFHPDSSQVPASGSRHRCEKS